MTIIIIKNAVLEHVQIRTQVNVVASSPNFGSGEFIEGEELPSAEQGGEIIEEEKPSSTTTTPAPPPTKPKPGFTLKLTSKHNSPVIVSPVVSTPVVVTAQKVDLPPPPPKKEEAAAPLEPTGVLNQIFETKVNGDQTTVVETKIIGTYIGTQYARVLESSSSIVKKSAKVEATKSLSFPSLVKPTAVTILAQKAPTTPEPPSSTTTSTSETENEHELDQDEREST